MQDRVLPQAVFRPVDDEGQRITIGAASQRSTALTHWKKFQIWATKVCWIKIGGSSVTAVLPSGSPVATGGSFPLAPGAIYEHEPQGSSDDQVAVIEDPNFTDAGYLFIGRAET